MIRLNFLQYNPIKIEDFNLSLDSLVSNSNFDDLCFDFLNYFGFKKLKTFSFSKEGFLGLFLELKGKIAVSLGETQALIDGAKLYESLGFEVEYLPLNKDGSIDLKPLDKKEFDYVFISSYVMDTFLKTPLEDVKKLTKAKIISNASANFSKSSDIIYFDNYKLSGYSLNGVICFNDDSLEQLHIGFTDSLAIYSCFKSYKNIKKDITMKDIFIEKLKQKFKDDLYFFVDNEKTLKNSFHIALKGIKAREIIRTLAFENIFLSNGEGCSLGLSKPSRVIQAMGYDETTSRNALSFSFNENLNYEKIDLLVDLIYKKYKQIRSFGE
ncbi:cysteine desulfurase [Aliarcobacter vitoriensis]|uniref:Cysteine desulfurase n=1 Tax=Aliarcobacter vitoriensis TaxID=2011099 RepID=A0A366MUX6_9BACT|nr:cysteine desulfurase [Aliarcobacter vitoriensis]RBQ29289.1 cysteine desulfurase [Aliarcobacter vitoriensis]